MHAVIYEKRQIEVKKAALRRIAKAEREDLCVACLRPFELGEKRQRGCCMSCYHATYRAIKQGKVTDAERVAEGKLLPPSPPGRPPSHPVSLEVTDL